MILRCSQLFCCSNRSFKEFLLSFPYLSSLWVGHCTAVATRRVEGGYPKYQRWPGALKMRRGDFHESCVAGAGGCCQAPPSSYLSISLSRQARGEGQVLITSPAATQLSCRRVRDTLQQGETADKTSRKNVF